MRSICWLLRSYSLLFFILILPSAVSAQQIVTEVPSEYEEPVVVWITPAEMRTSPLYKGRFSDTETALQLKHGNIVTVANEMISAFEASDWADNQDKKQKILNQLQRFMAAMKIALSTQGIDGVLDKKAEQNIFLQSLNSQDHGLNSLEIDVLFDANGQEVFGYFGETEDELLLYEYLEDGERVRLLLTRAQVREWRLLEDALTNLVLKQVELVRESNISELNNAVIRWENFLENGYSQMPWESTINGWLIDTPVCT